MNFEEALRAELITITGLSNKVFPVDAPEGTVAPYVVYESADKDDDKAHSGYLTTGRLTVTIDIYDKTYSGMKSFTNLVKNKIKTFQGRTIGTAGPAIQNVTFEIFNPELFEPNVNLYRKSLNFTVYF